MSEVPLCAPCEASVERSSRGLCARGRMSEAVQGVEALIFRGGPPGPHRMQRLREVKDAHHPSLWVLLRAHAYRGTSLVRTSPPPRATIWP